MAQHGEQAEYPVSSGAEHAEGNNKRPREDDPSGEEEGGPDKKRASTGVLGENGLGDPNPVGARSCPRPAWLHWLPKCTPLTHHISPPATLGTGPAPPG